MNTIGITGIGGKETNRRFKLYKKLSYGEKKIKQLLGVNCAKE